MAESKSEAGETKKLPRKKFSIEREEPEFSTQEKVQYFATLGAPIVVGVVLLFFLGLFLYRSFSDNVKPDVAKLSVEEDALKLLGQAAQFEREGNDLLAVEQLRLLCIKFPNSAARKRADQMLAEHEAGRPMFPRSRNSLAPRTEANPPPKEAPKPVDTVAEAKAKKAALEKQAAEDRENAKRALQLQTANRRSSLPVSTAATRRSLPSGLRAGPATPLHTSGWPIEVVSDIDSAEMVLVPAGKYQVLEPNGVSANLVETNAYYVDRFEVTRGRFEKFLAMNSSHPKPPPAAFIDSPTVDHPMVNITWYDADAYAVWAGKSLPTEVQWAIAAHGLHGNRYPWGSQPSDEFVRSGDQPLGRFLSSPHDRSDFAVFDLAGNATEWIKDSWDASITTGVIPRVIRGGAEDGAVSWRDQLGEDQIAPWLGFRTVLALPAEPNARPAPQPAPVVEQAVEKKDRAVIEKKTAAKPKTAPKPGSSKKVGSRG